MPQADSENWLASHEAANVIHRISAGFWIARTVRQKYAVRLQGQHIFRRRLRRDHRYLAAFSTQFAHDVLLDTEVIRDDVETRRLVPHPDNFVRQVRALAGLPNISVIGRD